MLESQKASNIRHNWKFDVVDLSRVPVQFLMVDEAKVREWIKANKESLNDGDIIAGIKFYKEVSVVTK